MGLLKAGFGALSGVLQDQWREFFYCDSLPVNVLVSRGHKRTTRRGSNKGDDNIISNGSIIAVSEGQCMLISEQGKVVEFCAEPGEFVYDTSTEPSIFSGNLGESIIATFKNIGKRFTFGGEAPKDQRVYYFNLKELVGNKYGTANPVPFRVVDNNVGLDMDISIRCFGEYSYRISDPLLFYTNVCGNVTDTYDRSQLDGQLKTELLTALQPAFAKISDMGIRYSSLPGHTEELSAVLDEVLSAKWSKMRGISVASFGVSSVKASEEDEKMIKELQRNAAYRNPNMAAATLVGAQAQAMQDAAKNTAAGPAMAFMGMNMAGMAGGMNAQNLYAMGQQPQYQQPQQYQQQQYQQPQQYQQQPAAPAPQPAAGGWKCPSCGHEGNNGKFCMECGTKMPEPAGSWTCPSCGKPNTGKFCMECGAKKPAGAPLYKCDKCGWQPDDPTHPPKFCPVCGDRFDDSDITG